jgi:hypothetical protein
MIWCAWTPFASASVATVSGTACASVCAQLDCPPAGRGPAGEQQQQAAASKGRQQAAQSAEAVRQLVEQAQGAAEAVRAGAEERSERHREACDSEEAALRERVAAEAEASRADNSSIDLEWEQLQELHVPQELHVGIRAVSAHCQRVLESKDAMLAAARDLLSQRDTQYVRLLQAQGEETDALIVTMRGQQERCRAVQEAELEAVEAAYLQVRPDLGVTWVAGWCRQSKHSDGAGDGAFSRLGCTCVMQL